MTLIDTPDPAHVCDRNCPPNGPTGWIIRFICCGHDDGHVYRKTWQEANELREAYISAPDHDRSAIIAAPAESPAVQAAIPVCQPCREGNHLGCAWDEQTPPDRCRCGCLSAVQAEPAHDPVYAEPMAAAHHVWLTAKVPALTAIVHAAIDAARAQRTAEIVAGLRAAADRLADCAPLDAQCLRVYADDIERGDI